MRKIVSRVESWHMAQTPIEEQEVDRANSQSSSIDRSNNYLGLIFLSILIFLFLAFLLFKRKAKEVRLSIFASLFLGFLLAVYTAIQVATQSLIGEEKTEQTNLSKRESNIDRTNKTKIRDRKPEEKTSNSEESLAKKESEENPKVISDETNLANSEAENAENLENNDNTGSNSSTNRQNNLVENPQTNSTNNESNISSSSISQNQESQPSPPEQNNNSSLPPQTNTFNTTSRSNPSRAEGNNSINPNLIGNSRDRNISSNSATLLLRPILKLGDRGFDVTLLQKILKELGYYTLNIDGYYGLSTELAVRNFQQQNNLLADGIVGFSTCNILKAKSTDTEIQCTF